MPNWVSNTWTIKGPSEELQRFKDHIAVKPTYCQDGEHDGFSFHSFITLPEGTDRDVYLGTRGVVNGEQVGTEEINWYNWNTINWGTKWDACEVDVTSTVNPLGEGLKTIYVSFNTAWSAPEPVWLAVSTMFPLLTFDIWYEEEQGWGGELTINNRVMTNYKTWDIPSSHADYDAQGKECPCSYESDPDYWYDDCPGKYKTLYTVEIVTKMYVIASTGEEAIEVAKAEESGYNLPDYTEVKKTLYSDEYRVTEAVKQEE